MRPGFERYRTRSEAEQLVRSFETSGLTRVQFCARNQVATNTFNRYMQRYGGRPKKVEPKQQLVAVEIVDDGRRRTEVAVVQCVCRQCGKEKVVIGYEQSEQLDVEPARYFVMVTKREKQACAGCAQGVNTAAVSERIIEKGLVSDRVVINTLVSRYSDHLPLYRQSVMLEREAGIPISRATMDGWVMRCGELLMPVAAAIGRELLAGGYIQADETPVPVQIHDGRGKNHQAYLWQYGRPGGRVMFDFRMGRSREGPLRFLSKFEGVLQTDGYSAYERTGGPKLVHAACWAHARRRFFEAAKLNPDDRVATQMIVRIASYAVPAVSDPS